MKKSSRDKLQLNQARSYAKVIHKIFSDTLISDKPCDKIMTALFRSKKSFGSRDRRMIGNSLYSLFRWFGWVAPLLGAKADRFDPKKMPAEDDQTWYLVLFLAQAIDGTELHPVAVKWKELANFRPYIDPMGELSIKQKRKQLDAIFPKYDFSPSNLVPTWFRKHAAVQQDEYRQLLAAMQQRPGMWIRLQTRDTKKVIQELKAKDLPHESHEKLSNAIYLGEARVNLYELESYKSGKIEIQDFASQCIGYACNAKSGERWWDTCAGAGGKSMQLASQMQNKGSILATDKLVYKLDDLKKRARRGGFHNINTREWTGGKLPSKPESFDGVLVDAPCSCTGTWRRNPDARWTTAPDSFKELTELQYRLLKNASPAVKVGGTLVYATCSISNQENEQVITEFLSHHNNFQLVPIEHPVIGEPERFLQIWPWQENCDGTFVVRMKRIK